MSSATGIVSSNVTLASVPVDPEEDLGLQGCLDGSVAWKEVDDDLLLGSEEEQQFVDFVLDEGDSELEVIQEVFDDGKEGEIDPAGNENELCNGVKVAAVRRKTTYEGPKNNRRYNVAGKLGYKCGVCLLRFSIMSHLFRHLLLKHRQAEDDRNRDERIYGRCRQCLKTFRTIPKLAEHLREVHKGAFFCGACLLVFKDKARLNRHRKLHVGMNPYVCDVCDKECSNMSHLICHRRTHFTGTDPTFSCSHCDRAFSSSGNLKKHVARVHTLEKRHQCPKCPETFIYTRQLKNHLVKSHTSKTLCQDCNKTFKTANLLIRHREKHHQTQDRPYSCSQCPARFKQSSHLKTHDLRAHSENRPYGCALCQRKFPTGSDLRRHQRTRKCMANRG